MPKEEPRIKWPRVPIPNSLFDILIFIAKSKGYNERTLYIFLYEALKTAYPEDMAKLVSIYGEPWDKPPDEPPDA